MKTWILAIVVMASMWTLPGAQAQEPGRLNVIIARGELRQQIESTPILQRPYRPLHFYGNAVRRRYYRGSALRLWRAP